MITRIDPDNFVSVSTVQVESDAGNPWLALAEIEDWAAAHGFVRTSEYHPRPVLVEGRRRFRGICFRLTEEDHAALDRAHQQMIERGDDLRRVAQAPKAANG